RRGVDYSKDDYILRRAGSVSELAYDNAIGAYRAKIESDFMRIQKQPNGSFIATNKLGVKYYFGQSDNSQVSGTLNNTSVVFRWALDKIEDTNHNIITYTYSSDSPVTGNNGDILINCPRYLDHIDYNGNQIKFYLENRSDAP